MRYLVFFAWFVFLFGDYNASTVTVSDLQTLKKFESLVYKITTKQDQVKDSSLYSKILRCIKKRNYKIKIYAKLEAIKGVEQKNDVIGTLGVQYNIFDPKEAKSANDSYILKKQQAIQLVTKYLALKEKIDQLKTKVEYYKLKEIRLKARQKSGIINLDDRLKNLEKIMSINEEFQDSKIKLFDLIHQINAICYLIDPGKI